MYEKDARVAARRVAWIEIALPFRAYSLIWSQPAGLRGLKFANIGEQPVLNSRSPQGCVD